MKKYERTIFSFQNIFLGFSVFILSFAIALEGPIPLWGYYWLIITLLLLLPLLAKFQVADLVVDKERKHLLVGLSRWFFLRKVEVYDLSQIQVAIKEERNKMGSKNEVFRIFNEEKILSEISIKFSGWKKEVLEEFSKTVSEAQG